MKFVKYPLLVIGDIHIITFLDVLAYLKTMFNRLKDTHAFMILSPTEYYRVLASITEYYRILQSITEYYRVLQSITEFYRVLQSIT